MTGTEEKPPPLWRLNSHQKVLESGALLNAIAFFAALPFASLYLADETSLSKPAIGAVVGGIAFSAAFGGILGGMLVDRFGAVRIMLVGLTLFTVDYALLATVRGDVLIVVLILALGVPGFLVNPGARKLLSLAADESGRVFRLRYMTLCLGGILGPLIGGALYSISPVWFFGVPAVTYFAYLILFAVRRRFLAELESPGAHSTVRFPLSKTMRDRRLLAATAAGLAIYFVFSQLESMIPLYMKGLYETQAHSYFAALFMTNAVLALAFQIPIDRISTKLSRDQLILLGCVNFAIAFFCFWAGSASIALLFVGIVFWTIGEGILLPTPDIAVHSIADDERKGAYFGFADIRYLGFFVGPVVGGTLLGAGIPLYFWVMALFIFVCAPLLIHQFSAPSDVRQQTLRPVMADD
ncbi:MFS transporter [Planotetraspora thailandica]|uniref:MFS transporter n=1 Tax=Planotetraspora thailandica TaxID=487172 RepID=A0A8J3UWL2_9ACTN|nr:MFS transporter [Planotetraspora thailandica]GII52757.1 MFS transporter [Planotetraspora thailandica]